MSVDYGNMKIISMHLDSRRRNVAAQVAEELKTDTYATPSMEERRKKKKESQWSAPTSPLFRLAARMDTKRNHTFAPQGPCLQMRHQHERAYGTNAKRRYECATCGSLVSVPVQATHAKVGNALGQFRFLICFVCVLGCCFFIPENSGNRWSILRNKKRWKLTVQQIKHWQVLKYIL